jgi:hypothetical protein
MNGMTDCTKIYKHNKKAQQECPVALFYYVL